MNADGGVLGVLYVGAWWAVAILSLVRGWRRGNKALLAIGVLMMALGGWNTIVSWR